MKIVDNGIGITDSQVNDPKNLGLVGLRERYIPGTVASKLKVGVTEERPYRFSSHWIIISND
jgi:hypothetical protein